MKKFIQIIVILLISITGTKAIYAEDDMIISEKNYTIENLIVTETVYSDHSHLRIIDGENILEINSNEDFYTLNGEIITYKIEVKETVFIEEKELELLRENYNNSNGKGDPYVLVSSSTMTYTQSQAIENFLASALGVALNWVLSLTLAIYQLIIDWYGVHSVYDEKSVYVQTDTYAYVPVLSAFYHHRFGLDSNYTYIPGTDYVDNNGLKAFLGL